MILESIVNAGIFTNFYNRLGLILSIVSGRFLITTLLVVPLFQLTKKI